MGLGNKHHGSIEFHCEGHDNKQLSIGAIVSLCTYYKIQALSLCKYQVMISLTSLFFLLCVISEMVEVNERRQVSKAAMMGSVNNSKHESKQLVRPLRSDPKTWSLQRKLLKVFCPSDAIQQLLEKTATKQLAGQHFIRLGFMMLKFNL